MKEYFIQFCGLNSIKTIAPSNHLLKVNYLQQFNCKRHTDACTITGHKNMV